MVCTYWGDRLILDRPCLVVGIHLSVSIQPHGASNSSLVLPLRTFPLIRSPVFMDTAKSTPIPSTASIALLRFPCLRRAMTRFESYICSDLDR